MADYAELCKRLRGAAKLERYYNASGKLFDDAADAIEELLADRDDWETIAKHKAKIIKKMESEQRDIMQQLPTWISVEERLPDLNQEVLVYAVGQIDGFFGDSVTAICKRVIFKLFPSCEGVEAWSSPWQYFHTDYKITHWMPLPAPPKGGNHDN